MTEDTQNNQAQDQKINDKELNFRQLEAKYERQLAQERGERERLTKELELKQQQMAKTANDEDDYDSEPYVDHKRLNKTLNKFGQATHSEIQKAMEKAKESAKEEVKREIWLESNPDFYEVLGHAEKLAQRSPKLAESILKMPDSFDRQKLVYENIKELGLHKPPEKQPSSIQEKIDLNKKSPYYQPSGIGTAPYSNAGDFSEGGQKNAYQKMKELQKRLRM